MSTPSPSPSPPQQTVRISPDNETSVKGEYAAVALNPSTTVFVQPSPHSEHGGSFQGVRIEPSSAAAVSSRDPLANLHPVQISYSNINFSIDIKHEKGVIENRQILKRCDGVFQPGKLTAMMGASGAGKTSLVNLISGNPTAGHVSGSICLNGEEVFDSMDRIRELSAFIQQDDVLMKTQTVREAITLSARLRLPKSMSDEEKLQRVDHTIKLLGLTKCADTIIGDAFTKGISGGEKRRVSMSLELIKSPSVLFLDEPTSGLDTFTAHSIVSLLRQIAHTQGKTIVCTIHQPSSDIFHSQKKHTQHTPDRRDTRR